MNKTYLGLSAKVWIAILALGVAIFIYVRHRPSSPSQPTAADSQDEGQLASDIAAQTAATLGGQPQDNSMGDLSWLAALIEQQNQSLQDFYSNFPSLVASGVGGGGVTAVGSSGGGGGVPGGFSGGGGGVSPAAAQVSSQTADAASLTYGAVPYDIPFTPFGAQTTYPVTVYDTSHDVPTPGVYNPGSLQPPPAAIDPGFQIAVNVPAQATSPQTALQYAAKTNKPVAI